MKCYRSKRRNNCIVAGIISICLIGLLVWIYKIGFLLQALLCLGAVIAVGLLHTKLGGNGKLQLYGIPFGSAIVFGLLLWFFGGRWYIYLGGPLLMLGLSTQTMWKSVVQKRIRVFALITAGVDLGWSHCPQYGF